MSLDALLRDLRLSLRQSRRQPGFALAIVSTLALAIAANVAVFSVVDAVLLRALPFRDPDRLLWITSVRPDNPTAPFSLPELMDYRSRTRTLSGLAAYANWSASLAGDGVTERLQGARMSADAFEVLGVSPAAGRLLRESDDGPDAPPVAVVSYRLWQRQLGGAAGAVGRSVRINAESYVIVGVLPRHFPFPLRDVDVVVPLAPDRDPLRHVRTSVNFLRFIGRASPGASREQVQAELSAICRALRQEFPLEYAQKEAVRAVPLHEALVGDLRPSMLVLLAAVLVVLGTALANLVSLVLVRAGERRGELAVRVAIGASRRELVRQLLVEALLLALAGSIAGGLLAAGVVQATVPFAPASIPRVGEVSVDATVLAFATLVAAAVIALLTLAPLGVVLRTRAGDVLRLASRGAVGDRWSGRVRQVLVAAEISAGLVLLLTTGALLENVRRLQDVPLGFRPDAVFQARVSIPPAYRSPDDLARFYDRLSERLAAMPGVETVGLVSIAPLSGLLATVPFAVEGEASRESDRPSVNLRAITPGYLEAVGTRVLEGRSFAETDRPDTPPVALVSRALAARFLREAPLGRRVLIDDNSTGPRPVEVVGVVEDIRQVALDGPPTLDVYIPLRQIHPDGAGFLRSNQFWMVRTLTAPAAFRETFVRQLRAVDEDAAVSGTGSMRQYVDAWLGPRRFALGLLGAFSLTGVFLALGGVYGLVSYAVSRRRREIGLRMAIGATEADVRRLVLRQAARLGVAGVAVGAALVATLRPLAASLAQDASLPPALALATAGLVLALVTVAAWLPARRAARISPTLALKDE
jgi:putative ABC transport system permease protein